MNCRSVPAPLEHPAQGATPPSSFLFHLCKHLLTYTTCGAPIPAHSWKLPSSPASTSTTAVTLGPSGMQGPLPLLFRLPEPPFFQMSKITASSSSTNSQLEPFYPREVSLATESKPAVSTLPLHHSSPIL